MRFFDPTTLEIVVDHRHALIPNNMNSCERGT